MIAAPSTPAVRAIDILSELATLRAETVEVLHEARVALELDERIDVSAVPVVRRIDALLEKLGEV